jgi:hypothetical protein
MVGVGHGSTILLERPPADSAVVELHELAVGFLALLLGEDKVAVTAGFPLQIVEIGRLTMRPGTVGPPAGFQLEQSQVQA